MAISGFTPSINGDYQGIDLFEQNKMAFSPAMMLCGSGNNHLRLEVPTNTKIALVLTPVGLTGDIKNVTAELNTTFVNNLSMYTENNAIYLFFSTVSTVYNNSRAILLSFDNAGTSYTFELKFARLFVDVTKITLTSPVSVVASEQLTLTATVSPSDATNKDIIWSVVSGPGEITGGNKLNATEMGTIVVRATINEGNLDGSAFTEDFSIEAVPDVNGILITCPSTKNVRSMHEITALVNTNSGNNSRDILWEISDPGIAEPQLKTDGNGKTFLYTRYDGVVLIRGRIIDGIGPGEDFVSPDFAITASYPSAFEKLTVLNDDIFMDDTGVAKIHTFFDGDITNVKEIEYIIGTSANQIFAHFKHNARCMPGALFKIQNSCYIEGQNKKAQLNLVFYNPDRDNPGEFTIIEKTLGPNASCFVSFHETGARYYVYTPSSDEVGECVAIKDTSPDVVKNPSPVVTNIVYSLLRYISNDTVYRVYLAKGPTKNYTIHLENAFYGLLEVYYKDDEGVTKFLTNIDPYSGWFMRWNGATYVTTSPGTDAEIVQNNDFANVLVNQSVREGIAPNSFNTSILEAMYPDLIGNKPILVEENTTLNNRLACRRCVIIRGSTTEVTIDCTEFIPGNGFIIYNESENPVVINKKVGNTITPLLTLQTSTTSKNVVTIVTDHNFEVVYEEYDVPLLIAKCLKVIDDKFASGTTGAGASIILTQPGAVPRNIGNFNKTSQMLIDNLMRRLSSIKNTSQKIDTAKAIVQSEFETATAHNAEFIDVESTLSEKIAELKEDDLNPLFDIASEVVQKASTVNIKYNTWKGDQIKFERENIVFLENNGGFTNGQSPVYNEGSCRDIFDVYASDDPSIVHANPRELKYGSTDTFISEEDYIEKECTAINAAVALAKNDISGNLYARRKLRIGDYFDIPLIDCSLSPTIPNKVYDTFRNGLLRLVIVGFNTYTNGDNDFPHAIVAFRNCIAKMTMANAIALLSSDSFNISLASALGTTYNTSTKTFAQFIKKIKISTPIAFLQKFYDRKDVNVFLPSLMEITGRPFITQNYAHINPDISHVHLPLFSGSKVYANKRIFRGASPTYFQEFQWQDNISWLLENRIDSSMKAVYVSGADSSKIFLSNQEDDEFGVSPMFAIG